ncbi:MAG: universal stress protein [Acidobacteriota bacterium]
MKVLIATEGSPCSQAAVRSVAERPWPEGSEFRVLTVIERPPIYGTVMATDHIADDIRCASERIAIDAASTLQEFGRNASYTIPQSAADEEIINEAKEWGANLILVGTHSRHGFSHLLLGSVARNVSLNAPCSVEIVRALEHSTT